jgi:hypothetical protein
MVGNKLPHFFVLDQTFLQSLACADDTDGPSALFSTR